MIWAALVIKTGLVDNQKMHDLVFVEADRKDQAIAIISGQDFSMESWWNKGKSKCLVLKIYQIAKEKKLLGSLLPVISLPEYASSKKMIRGSQISDQNILKPKYGVRRRKKIKEENLILKPTAAVRRKKKICN